MKTILITAYAMNPYKGSEDGTAWNMVAQIARHHRVIAITRKNNEAPIRQYLAAHPFTGSDRLTMLYFDLPYWMRFWKKGGRGALLYFYMWQIGIVGFVRRQALDFNIAHNLNFHSSWTPSFLWRLGKPLVWGPIGHHPPIPKGYFDPLYGKKEEWMDKVKWATKQFFWHFDPFLALTKRKAKVIIGINSSIGKVLRVPPSRVAVIPAVGADPVVAATAEPHNAQFTVLSIGRFVPLKGFDLAIRGFAAFYQQLPNDQRARTRLVLVGKGSFKKTLQTLAQTCGVGDAVEWIDWIDRSELVKLYARAAVFLFPSHEGAGMVVPEALSYGVPVVCFDNIGPGESIDPHSGIRVPYTTYSQSVADLGAALSRLFSDNAYHAALRQGALARFEERFDWTAKGLAISKLYENL